MNELLKQRVLKETDYILKTNETIRNVAKEFKVSKSTVYTDLSERLPKLDKDLQNEVDRILKEHDASKHIRGGEATRLKYKKG